MSKEIDLSRKTITEDKNGNASITGRVSTEGAIVDAKDLTTKEYVDNAIAQAAIGGEVDTSGFALKTELPTKTSQLTNDSGFMTSIPDEYVTNSELEQTLIPYGQELDKKSNIINYSDHTLNGVETYNNLEKLNTSEISETEVVYIIDKSINLTKGSICSIEVKFSDNTNLLLQGEVVSNVLNQKEVNYIQIMGQTPMGIMLIDKAKYSIGDNNTTSIQHNDNASTLMVLHPNANNVISLTITKPTVFEINNSFFTNYQFVNDTEKENWNNKADKSEIPNIEGLASESFVNQQISEAQEEVDYKIINSKLWYDISNEIEIDLAERNYNAYIPNTRFNVDDYVYTVLNTSLNLEKDTCYYLVIGTQKETGVSAIITGEYPVITQEITDGIIYAVCDSRITVYDNCDYVNGELIKADGKSVIKIKNAFSYPIKVARMSVMPTKYVPITDDFFNSHKFVSEEQLSQISTTYEQLNLKADKSELFSKDYNDLINIPYGDTREYTNINISYWNGQIGERENVVLGDYTFVKMDDLSNCPDNVNHCEYYGYCRLHTDGSAGAPIYYSSMEDHSDINDYYLCKHDNGAYLCAIVIKDSVVLINDLSINLTKGLWFIQTINPNLDEAGTPEHILKTVTKTDLEKFELTLITGELKLIDNAILGNKPGLVIRNEKGDVLGEIFNNEDNIASEPFSHAEGCSTQATARGAHVEGFFTKASGLASHAEGYHTEAASQYQHVQGKYNIEDTENKYAHIVGNGDYNACSNAHTLDWNGNAWFQGNVFVKGTSQDDAEKLATEEFVNDAIDNMSEGFSGDYNDLSNKPVYDTRTIENVVLEIDKDMDLSNYETKDILVIPDGSYYYKLVKLRPAYPGDIDNMKESGTLTIGENTMSIKEAIDIDPDDNYGEGVELILEFLIIVERDEFNYFPGGPIESGIWMLHSAYIIDENGELVEQASGVELYDGMIIRYDSLSSGELRRLDKKFIPDSIATKEYVNDQIAENKFSGDYNDLENKPTIPSIEGLATESFVIDKIANVSEKFIDVVIDNNNIDIISSFSDTAKIARKINVGPDGRNNVVNFDTVSLIYNDGRTESIYSTTDDTAPIRAQFGYIGGNHGHLGFTLKSNGQTQEDVGSIWTDGTTDYVLVKVQDDKCYFAYNQYRLSSGKLMYNKKDADANLTPKSGATNTNSLDISTRVTSVQLYPSINRHTIEYYFDDKKVVTPNGSYKCDKFAIKEQYNVMKFDAMHEFLTTHIGSNLNDDAIDGFATFTITYEFTKGCKCNIYHSLAALDIIELTNTGFIQQAYGFNSNYTVSKIIPGVGTVDNFNFATGVNLKNITKEINIYRNNLINEDASVSRDVNIAYKDSIPQFIFTNGYLIDKTDSAKRKDYINEDLCLWKINASNKKTYPVAVNGMTLNEGDYLSFSMYRNFNPINDNVTSFNMIKNGEDIYFMIDNLDTVVTNIILDEYIGERLEILESNNFELLSDTIDSNGLRFRGTDVSYAILKITKDPQTGDDCDLTGLQTKEDEGLNTEDKTIVGAINEINSENENLRNQMNELFQNVSSGKELIASAITDKGVDASEEETFQSLSEKINQIPVGPPGSNIIGYINENNDIYVSLTELESGTYTLKFEDYTGLLNEFDDIGTVEV